MTNDETRVRILRIRISSLFRHSSFVIRVLAVLLTTLLGAPHCVAQAHTERPAPLDPVQAERQARELVAEMLSQQPAQDTTNTGLLKIRGADDHEHEVPVRFCTRSTPTNWANVYTTLPSNHQVAVTLTIIHTEGHPNEYFLYINSGRASTNEATRVLSGAELMKPFADSDFWVADLGLEFLHWPGQRLLKKEVRRNKFCDVLQSLNPEPVSGGYARIDSWITHEAPHGIVHADAYDSKGNILKRFDPTEFKKVQGQWQLESMEIRNLKAESRSIIEFNLK